MKPILRCVLLATACGVAPTIRADVPLPADIAVVSPAPDVPKEVAAFSGRWVGNWSGVLQAMLIVESIDGERANVIYAWGDAPKWNTKAGYGRFKANVTGNGKSQLTFQNANGSLRFVVTMNQGLKSINVQRTAQTATVSETFTKAGP